MIYMIHTEHDLIVETDNLEYVKKVVRAHPDCLIRELGSGKVYRPKLVAQTPLSLGSDASRSAEAKVPLPQSAMITRREKKSA